MGVLNFPNGSPVRLRSAPVRVLGFDFPNKQHLQANLPPFHLDCHACKGRWRLLIGQSRLVQCPGGSFHLLWCTLNS